MDFDGHFKGYTMVCSTFWDSVPHFGIFATLKHQLFFWFRKGDQTVQWPAVTLTIWGPPEADGETRLSRTRAPCSDAHVAKIQGSTCPGAMVESSSQMRFSNKGSPANGTTIGDGKKVTDRKFPFPFDWRVTSVTSVWLRTVLFAKDVKDSWRVGLMNQSHIRYNICSMWCLLSFHAVGILATLQNDEV